MIHVETEPISVVIEQYRKLNNVISGHRYRILRITYNHAYCVQKIATLSNERKTDWDEQLPFVTFNYNATIHATTKQIPFEMMFGRLPVLPFDHQDEMVSLEQNSEHVNKLNQYLSSLTEQAKATIKKTQEKYKSRYDDHRSNPSYNTNDLVLVKSLRNRHKFDIRHEGPFKIIQRLTD
ncbi:unnamed protein product, partial [Didymodactylos carnosus]